MKVKLILLSMINVIICMSISELEEMGTSLNRGPDLSEDEARVDDIIQGLCVYKNAKNNSIRQVKHELESLLIDMGIYKDVITLNKKLRDDLKWILQETRRFKEVSSIFNLPKVEIKDKCFLSRPIDCSDIIRTSGVYTIYPDANKGVDVFCDMTTVGGGWTIMQRHSGSTVDFQRTWVEYEQGFGDPSGDLWLGNKILHELTSKNKYELRIELTDTNNKIKYASYKTFKIGDSSSKYKLTIGDYSGNAIDRMAYSNGMKFTTKDQDNDRWSQNCAVDNNDGPWWLKECTYSGLNRKYSSKLRWDGISVIKSVMMIRRL